MRIVWTKEEKRALRDCMIDICYVTPAMSNKGLLQHAQEEVISYERRSKITDQRVFNYKNLINDARVKARSGSYYAWLGGGDNETAVLSQDISVQSDATFLRVYYLLNSSEQCGNRYDMAQFSVNGVTLPNGNLELCARNNTRSWTAKTFNLNPYVGQTVTLSIKVTTDTTVVSSLWLDDVGFVRRASDEVESDDRSSGEHVNARSTIR
jgi:hypothetical protein